LGLVLGRGDDEGDRVAEFHDVVDKDFDVVSTRGLEFYLAEKGHVGCVKSGIFEGEFHFAFSQHGCLVGSDEADGFGEVADASGPTIEEAKAKCHDWHLRDTDKVHDANEEEVAGNFLADFFAEEGALEVGEDAGSVHLFKSKGWRLKSEVERVAGCRLRVASRRL
jgi:hypothetical protein